MSKCSIRIRKADEKVEVTEMMNGMFEAAVKEKGDIEGCLLKIRPECDFITKNFKTDEKVEVTEMMKGMLEKG